MKNARLIYQGLTVSWRYFKLNSYWFMFLKKSEINLLKVIMSNDMLSGIW